VCNRQRKKNRIELVDEAITESAAPLHGKFRKRDGPATMIKKSARDVNRRIKLQKRLERNVFYV
jgi:hypothetical protein